jgi:hypothetical protein
MTMHRSVVNGRGVSELVEMTPEEEADILAVQAAAQAMMDGVGPPRDERLLAAVDQATTAVTASDAFTDEQKVILAGVFAGLGAAIAGDDA